MVTKQININGTPVTVKYREEYMNSYFNSKMEFRTQYFIRWDHQWKCAAVDKMAPDWYKLLASLHETIDTGRQYEELVPGLAEVDENRRSACIEKFVVANAGEYKKAYVAAKAVMLKTLLDNELCTPDRRKSIEYSVEALLLSINPVPKNNPA